MTPTRRPAPVAPNFPHLPEPPRTAIGERIAARLGGCDCPRPYRMARVHRAEGCAVTWSETVVETIANEGLRIVPSMVDDW